MSQTREGQSFHRVSRQPKVHCSNVQRLLSPQGAGGVAREPTVCPAWVAARPFGSVQSRLSAGRASPGPGVSLP